MDDMQIMLASAIEDFDVEMARMLIVENDVVPKNVNEEAMLLFIQNAVISNDKPLLQQLLKYDSRLNGKVLWKVLDNVGAATLFVCAGADLNVTQGDSSTSTFLHILLASKDPNKIKLAELMIDKGANISAVDDYGHTVLQSAIRGGAPIDFIRKLIWNSVGDFEKNVVAIADSDRCAELMPTVLSFIKAYSVDEATRMKLIIEVLYFLTVEYQACRKDAIIAFLQLVIPPHILDSKDEPVRDIRRLLGSHLAGKILWYMFDDIKIASMLVRSGADVNVTENGLVGSSLLHMLAGSKDLNKIKLAELIIEYGANINAVNLVKDTVLGCAIHGGAPKEFIRMLIRKSLNNFADNVVTIADSKRNTELLPEVISLIAHNSVDKATRINRVIEALMSLSSPSPLMFEKTRKVAIERLLRLVMPAHMFNAIVDVSEFNNTILKNTYLGGKILWFMLDDMKMATMLIRSGANLHVRRDDDLKQTFLHVLSVSNDPHKIKLAEMMIDRNADINAVDRNECSVLQCAINAGARKDFISKLIWKSANNFEKNAVTIADSKQKDLLPVLVMSIMASSIDEATRSKLVKDAIYSLIDHPAIKITKSRRKVIAYLLKHAMPVDMFDSRAYAFLSEAILTKNHKFVELLLQYGADPNSDKYKELSLLWYAATMEESSMAILLIKYGADVNRQSRNGVRPIHGACKSSSINNLLLLIRLGADINAVDYSGQTPLIIVSSKKDSLEKSDSSHIIIRRLALQVLKGAKINSHDMGLIQNSTILQMLFDSCMDELQRMQEMEIVEGIPYSNFFIESVERTSKYIRRNDLTNISRDDSFIAKLENLIPFYNNDFRDAYNFAEARQRLVMEKEQLLSGIVSELYQITLPDMVICKIVNYLCFDEELKRYVLEFHLSTRK